MREASKKRLQFSMNDPTKSMHSIYSNDGFEMNFEMNSSDMNLTPNPLLVTSSAVQQTPTLIQPQTVLQTQNRSTSCSENNNNNILYANENNNNTESSSFPVTDSWKVENPLANDLNVSAYTSTSHSNSSHIQPITSMSMNVDASSNGNVVNNHMDSTNMSSIMMNNNDDQMTATLNMTSKNGNLTTPRSSLPVGGIRVPNPFLQQKNNGDMQMTHNSNQIPNMYTNSASTTANSSGVDGNIQFSSSSSNVNNSNSYNMINNNINNTSTNTCSSTAVNCRDRANSMTSVTFDSNSNTNRRQKRLERNRESARLSRRRRKQYLEVLEERVSKLSIQMDEGRIQHVSKAVKAIHSLRVDHVNAMERKLQNVQADPITSSGQNVPNNIDQSQSAIDNTNHSNTHELSSSLEVHDNALHTVLSRSSNNLKVVASFQKQQLKSYVLPPHVRFIQWLTLQNDSYFLGGRAVSERLSAARIGERMLNAGNDRVPPAQSMWPLFCNEVNLSYDQEERVRMFQRATLTKPNSWLDNRHSIKASGEVNESIHDCIVQLSDVSKQSEKSSILDILTVEQRAKLYVWLNKHKQKDQDQRHSPKIDILKSAIQKIMFAATTTSNDEVNTDIPLKNNEVKLNISQSYHNATNIYIINNHLQSVLQKPFIPKIDPLIKGRRKLMRLTHRPPFESLGGSGTGPNSDGKGLNRDRSFSSSGSLKRNASNLSLSCEGDERERKSSFSSQNGEPYNGQNYIIPEAAQSACHADVIKALKPAGIQLPERVCTPPSNSSNFGNVLNVGVNDNLQNKAITANKTIQKGKTVSPASIPPNTQNLDQIEQFPTGNSPNTVTEQSHIQQMSTLSAIDGNMYIEPTNVLPQNMGALDPNNNQRQQKKHRSMQQQLLGSRSVSVPSILPSGNSEMIIVPEEEDFQGNSAMEYYFLDIENDNDWAIGGIDIEADT